MTVVASKFARAANNLYETEPWVTRALMRHFPPVQDRKVWEPAAGNHAIAHELGLWGARVYTSDITTYSEEHTFIYDFLVPRKAIPLLVGDCNIITNPPYGEGCRDAVRFARLALDCAIASCDI